MNVFTSLMGCHTTAHERTLHNASDNMAGKMCHVNSNSLQYSLQENNCHTEEMRDVLSCDITCSLCHLTLSTKQQWLLYIRHTEVYSVRFSGHYPEGALMLCREPVYYSAHAAQICKA